MNIQDYIECINKAFEAKYPDKGFFVVIMLNEHTTFPIFKRMKVSVLHYPSNKEVHSFIFLDKVPAGHEEEFNENCLKELVTTLTYKMEELWKYGESDV